MVKTYDKKNFLSRPVVVALIAMFCCALWGSATPFIKIGYQLVLTEQNVPSVILFAGVRFFTAGLITALFYSLLRRKVLLPQKRNIGAVTLVGLFETVIQYIAFYVGMVYTTGVKAAVINGSCSFLCILCAVLIFRQEKFNSRKIVACILGFIGIVLINLKGLSFQFSVFGDGLILVANFAYAISTSLLRKYSVREEPVVMSSYQLMIGGFIMILTGFACGGQIVIKSIQAVAVLFYLSVLSGVAYSLWSILLKYNSVSKVSIYNFMGPVFGVVLSSILLKEQSTVTLPNLILALCLICIGIIMLNFQKEKNN